MLRSAFSRVAPVLPRVQATLGQRAYSGIQGFDDRERAAESVYFKKEDERVLQKLLKRIQIETQQHGAEGAKEASDKALHKIVGKYNMSEADKAALEEWKQSH